jgi:hypothetical protein
MGWPHRHAPWFGLTLVVTLSACENSTEPVQSRPRPSGPISAEVNNQCVTPVPTFPLTPLLNQDAFQTSPAIVNLDDGVNAKVAQKISGIAGQLGRVRFRVSMSGAGASGGDRVVVTLQTDDAGKPSGTVLASTDAGEQVGTTTKGGFFPIGNSQVAPRPDLFVPSGSTWDGTLDGNATYWLVFERKDATTTAYYLLGADNNNPFAGGQIAVFDGTTWQVATFAGFDLMMELVGSLCAAEGPVNPPPTAVACITTDPAVAPFVHPLDPSPSNCIHNAKVHGYLGANQPGSTAPPTTFPPNIEVRGGSSTGDGLSYQWAEGSDMFGTDANIDLSRKLGPGQHTVVLTVRDTRGTTAADQVQITIPDLVVLVHGWHGSPDVTFGVGGKLLGNDYLVAAYDYSGRSSCTASSPIETLPGSGQGIADDFRDFVQNGLVGRVNSYAGNIDVLAHSTGGLVTRQFMVGTSYRHELKRVIMAGTPNYGLDWATLAKLASCLKSPGPQEQELLFSSEFVWKLSVAWNNKPLGEPIDARNILALAGQLSVLTGKLGDGDGVTRAWSAALAFERMFSIAYLPLAHSTSLFVTADRTLVLLAQIAASNAYSYGITKQFIETGQLPLPSPDFSVPKPDITAGLVLLRLIDDATNQPIDLSAACKTTGGAPPPTSSCDIITLQNIDFGYTLTCSKQGVDCKPNALSGLLTFAGVPGGRYRLSGDRFKTYALPAQPVVFTVFNSRPLALEVRLRALHP